MGVLARLFGTPAPRARRSRARPKATDAPDQPDFVCSTCGRTDHPEAGDWDPPICLDCDAAINFDAEVVEVGESA